MSTAIIFSLRKKVSVNWLNFKFVKSAGTVAKRGILVRFFQLPIFFGKKKKIKKSYVSFDLN